MTTCIIILFILFILAFIFLITGASDTHSFKPDMFYLLTLILCIVMIIILSILQTNHKIKNVHSFDIDTTIIITNNAVDTTYTIDYLK